MAARKWKIFRSYGYAGTSSEEVVDICDYLGIDEQEAEAMSDDEADVEMNKIAWDAACEQVDAGATPIE